MYVLYACIFSLLFSVREKRYIVRDKSDTGCAFVAQTCEYKYHDIVISLFETLYMRLSNYTLNSGIHIFGVYHFSKLQSDKHGAENFFRYNRTQVINFCTFVIYNYIYVRSIYIIYVQKIKQENLRFGISN